MTDRSADPDKGYCPVGLTGGATRADRGSTSQDALRAPVRTPIRSAFECEAADQLLAKGWHLSGFAIRRPGEPREYRLILRDPVQGKKLFGFGKDFAEALANAAGQV